MCELVGTFLAFFLSSYLRVSDCGLNTKKRANSERGFHLWAVCLAGWLTGWLSSCARGGSSECFGAFWRLFKEKITTHVIWLYHIRSESERNKQTISQTALWCEAFAKGQRVSVYTSMYPVALIQTTEKTNERTNRQTNKRTNAAWQDTLAAETGHVCQDAERPSETFASCCKNLVFHL